MVSQGQETFGPPDILDSPSHNPLMLTKVAEILRGLKPEAFGWPTFPYTAVYDWGLIG